MKKTRVKKSRDTVPLTLVREAIKTNVDLQLGVIFDSPDNHSKEGGTPAVTEASTSHLERAKESITPPSRQEYTKTAP